MSNLTQILPVCDVRTVEHFPNNEVIAHGNVVYRYNSIGFRGEEFNPDAKFRIAAFGCSIAHGTGLNIEDTFLYKLKIHISEILGFDPVEVNLMNFAVGGHSNDYAVRSILTYSKAVNPDIVLYNLVALPRIEMISENQIRNLNIGSVTAENLHNVTDHKLLAFLDLYEPESGFINAVKNILLAGYYLKSESIPYLIVNGTVDFDAYRQNSFCNSFISKLDLNRLTTHHFHKKPADMAADGNHAGPLSNSAMAIHILPELGRVLKLSGNTNIGFRLEEAGICLREESDVYRHCMNG
jgi:hypothetical protein